MADTKKKDVLPGTINYYSRVNKNPSNSSDASAALGNVISNSPGQYKPSDTVQNAYSQLQGTLNNKPGDYQSQYSETMKNLLNNILNQKDFSYDFNADVMYQNYKNQYMQQGKQAMQDTQAAASALTGGYGSSYATSAASQAYQQYLTALNDKLPELYNMALQKYQLDTDKMYNQFSAVGQQEDREYGQYRDTVSDWQSDRNFGLNQYDTMYSQDYGAYRDQVSDYYNDRDFYANRQDSLWNQEQSEKEFAYQQYADQRNYDYNVNRDQVSDSQWQQTFDYNANRDQISDKQWQQTFDYNAERDKVSDAQWEKEYALSKYNATKSSTSSSSSSGYSDGKKLTSTIQNQIDYLEGEELDSYLGQLVEAGYSYEAIEDYLLQSGKDIEAGDSSYNYKYSQDLESDYKEYLNRLRR